MISPINKKTLENLAKLARIELDPREEKKFLTDLEEILDYFEELKTVDTRKTGSLTDKPSLKNVFREDEPNKVGDQHSGRDQFPETEDGFLKVPPVFE